LEDYDAKVAMINNKDLLDEVQRRFSRVLH
jgi:hypothetical protein